MYTDSSRLLELEDPADMDAFATYARHQRQESRQVAILTAMIDAEDIKFRSVCAQLVLLNNQVREVHARYQRAMAAGRLSFRYSLRLRMTTLEKVRDLYTKYAHELAARIDAMEARVCAE